MPGPWDTPEGAGKPTPSSEPDLLDQARMDAWRPPNYRDQKENFFLKPESLTGEALMAGGILGRVLLNSTPIGRRVALGVAAAGLLVTALSALERPMYQDHQP